MTALRSHPGGDLHDVLLKLAACDKPDRRLDAEVALALGALKWTPLGIYEGGARDKPLIGLELNSLADAIRVASTLPSSHLGNYTLAPLSWARNIERRIAQSARAKTQADAMIAEGSAPQ